MTTGNDQSMDELLEEIKVLTEKDFKSNNNFCVPTIYTIDKVTGQKRSANLYFLFTGTKEERTQGNEIVAKMLTEYRKNKQCYFAVYEAYFAKIGSTNNFDEERAKLPDDLNDCDDMFICILIQLFDGTDQFIIRNQIADGDGSVSGYELTKWVSMPFDQYEGSYQ